MALYLTVAADVFAVVLFCDGFFPRDFLDDSGIELSQLLRIFSTYLFIAKAVVPIKDNYGNCLSCRIF